jgi:hypothetical protein
VLDPGGNRGTVQPTPPKARLTFRVGAVGHRFNKLSAKQQRQLEPLLQQVLSRIQDRIKQFLQEHAELFQPAPATVRVISPLAEGADQLISGVARKLGFELHAVLPFNEDSFVKTFSEAAQTAKPSASDTLRSLLEEASARVQLDGDSNDKERAYAMAASIVLSQADLLIAIWNGRPGTGSGGTAESVRQATSLEIPVIWLNPATPNDWRLLSSAADFEKIENGLPISPGSAESLDELIGHLLELPPNPATSKNGHRDEPFTEFATDYLRERQPSNEWLGWFWNAFRNELNGEPVSFDTRVRDFVGATREEWSHERGWFTTVPAGAMSAITAAIDAKLVEHYAWANGLAVLYANRYRSTFVLNYLLAALAVVFALAGVALSWIQIAGAPSQAVRAGTVLSALLEFACLSLIILNTYRGRFGRWQARWIDYRLLAEALRQFRFLSPLGGATALPRVSGHLVRYGDPRTTWMAWHLRNIIRSAGLQTCTLNSGEVEQYRSYVRHWLIEGQISHHRRNARRLDTVRDKLHRWGDSLFIGTWFICGAHVLTLLVGWHLDASIENLSTALLAVFPAVGAAFAAIRSQGEFQRMVKRSMAMVDQLQRYDVALTSLVEQKADSLATRELITRVSLLMIREVSDWRVIFLDRPLDWPA